MSPALRVVIVGAGIGGLTCAIASRKQGLDVIVLERAAQLAPVGAGIQIPPNASRIWYQYGILEKLKRYSVVLEATQLRRWENGNLLCSRNVGENLDERWPWILIHRADYQRVLVEEANSLGVDVRLKAEVGDISFDTTKVVLTNGDEIFGDVIIAADGLWSTIRDRVLDHDSPPQETGDLAYRGTFSLSSLHALRDESVDCLCTEKVSTMWLGPKSHAVFYPVKSGKEFNLVIIRPDDLPPGVKTQEGDLPEMRALFEGWDPILTKILTAFPSVLKWKMLHHHELQSWTKGNVALLGDACHPSLPYQAQGAAMAVEDGAIIATLLGLYQQSDVKLKERLSMAETLKLYESLQKARTTTLHLGNLSNQHLYHLEDGAEQEERDAILKAAQWQERPEGESEQFIWIDVRYQKAIVARDAVADAKEKWDKVTQSLFNQDSFIEL